MAAFVCSLFPDGFTPRPALAEETFESIGEAPYISNATYTTDPGTIELAAVGLSVNPGTREASQAFYLNNFIQDMPSVGWSGSIAGCNPGTQSAEYRAAILNQIAYYRAMAGVPSGISLSSAFNQKAQQAALIMAANRSLSHTPSAGWTCYTAGGAEGASNSNLSIQVGSNLAPPWDPVTAYMRDFGSGNAAVGHRRWLLYPQTQTFGTGDVHHLEPPPNPAWPEVRNRVNGNSIWLFDGRWGSARPAVRDEFVAWPPKGYVPWMLVFDRFSFSHGTANFAGAGVSMKIGNQNVPIVVESRTDTGRGENTIVWSRTGMPSGVIWPPGPDVTFTITVSNVIVGGVSRTFTYDVTAFDPYTGGTSVELSNSSDTVGSMVDFELSDFPPNRAITIKWERPTGTVDTLPETVTTNGSGQASGTFQVPAVPGGPGHRVVFEASGGGGSGSEAFEVVPKIVVSPGTVGRGQSINVSLRGLGRQETVVVKWRQSNGTLSEIGSVATSNSGSANVTASVPAWAWDGTHTVRADGPTLSAQTTAVRVQGGTGGPPSASISPISSTVNNWITWSISSFPANSQVSITWIRLSGGSIAIATVYTDEFGEASGQFRVPATPGGVNQRVSFASGSVSADALFEVKPRIKVNTSPGHRGEIVDVSLRGYAKQESVRIRWQNPVTGSWVELATITTSNTGSSNTNIVVPSWAAIGMNSVRGDGTEFRQQTNAALIADKPVTPSEQSTPTPTASPTAQATKVPDEAPGTPAVEPTPEPTPTEPAPEPTQEPPTPTAPPAETPTPTPDEASDG
ncbi:MAG: CAP domain-containing protein [Thermomicrobiales bacterium]|nr:CAP domain-containing protein [Thermomicrobiales bacterium]